MVSHRLLLLCKSTVKCFAASDVNCSLQLVTGTVQGEGTEDENGNLMWLVDFRLSDLLTDIDGPQQQQQQPSAGRGEPGEPERKRSRQEEEVVVAVPAPALESQQPAPTAPLPLTLELPACRTVSAAKPNYTYTDLITLALRDKTSLTVSGIYQWIT